VDPNLKKSFRIRNTAFGKNDSGTGTTKKFAAFMFYLDLAK
jgi:hypothetical protein